VDATNAVGIPIPEGHATMGDFVASLVPDGVAVVKAFNTIGVEHLSSGHIGDTKVFLPIAGDDPGRSAVITLAERMGFDTADLGDRNQFWLSEAHAQLWIHLAFRAGWGRDFGFGVVRR